MKILIAEDEAISRRLLQARLTEWGYEVVACSDGIQAREALQAEDPPQLAYPGLDDARDERAADLPRVAAAVEFTLCLYPTADLEEPESGDHGRHGGWSG